MLLGDDYPAGTWQDVLTGMGPDNALKGFLTRWCLANPTPLVLLVDEIDSLVGDTLLSVLRQLRAGYQQRPRGFPASVVLCGVRDIRDYRIRSSSGELIAGGSPFNVAAKSLRLGDFTEAETRALMAQHTEETGQRFTEAAQGAVWTQTCGQPWLANALCAGACFENEAGRDRSRPIDADAVYAAREELILSRRTHLDQLAHKLGEDRVRRVVGPMLSGGDAQHDGRHLEYARDLGLLAPDSPPRVANPIYAEVVPRELGYILQSSLDECVAWYVGEDGRLDMAKLLGAFRTFFGEHAEHWLGRFGDYREAAPQLILQAYLQRIVNGGGRIEREYGLGRGRTDLLVLWPREAGQPSDLRERFVVACKVLRDADRKSRGDGGAPRGADPRLHGAVRRRGRASGGGGPPRRGAAAGRRRRRTARRRPRGARRGHLDAVATPLTRFLPALPPWPERQNLSRWQAGCGSPASSRIASSSRRAVRPLPHRRRGESTRNRRARRWPSGSRRRSRRCPARSDPPAWRTAAGGTRHRAPTGSGKPDRHVPRPHPPGRHLVLHLQAVEHEGVRFTRSTSSAVWRSASSSATSSLQRPGCCLFPASDIAERRGRSRLPATAASASSSESVFPSMAVVARAPFAK